MLVMLMENGGPPGNQPSEAAQDVGFESLNMQDINLFVLHNPYEIEKGSRIKSSTTEKPNLDSPLFEEF
jgi:hypothetical protein